MHNIHTPGTLHVSRTKLMKVPTTPALMFPTQNRRLKSALSEKDTLHSTNSCNNSIIACLLQYKHTLHSYMYRYTRIQNTYSYQQMLAPLTLLQIWYKSNTVRPKELHIYTCTRPMWILAFTLRWVRDDSSPLLMEAYSVAEWLLRVGVSCWEPLLLTRLCLTLIRESGGGD